MGQAEGAIGHFVENIKGWIDRQFEEGKLGGMKVADLLKLGFLGAGVLASLVSHIQNGLPENSSEVADLLNQYGTEGGQAKMVVRLEREWASTIIAEQKRYKTEEPGHLHGLKEIAILIWPKSSEIEKEIEKNKGAFDRALIELRITPFEELPRLVVAVVTRQDRPAINRPATREELEIFASLLQKNPPLEEI